VNKRKKTRQQKSRLKKLRLAFIDGAGSATRLHVPGLTGNPDAEVIAIAQVDGATSHPGWSKAKGYQADYVRMIETEKPDAVYVMASPNKRYDIAATVLDMGCHLFVNKPPALSSEQIRQLAILARKKKALTGVVFYRRFSPLLRRGKILCQKNGPVHSAVASFYKDTGKRPYERGGIEALTSDAIHAVDTIRYLCGGEVVSVASDVRRLEAEHHTTHYALVKFSTGAVGVVLTNFMCGRRMFTVEIHSPGISCFGDLEEAGYVYANGKTDPVETLTPLWGKHDPDYYRKFGIQELIVPKSAWHTDVNSHFFDCLRRNKQPETHFEDALKTMELVDAIFQSQI
jgi:virulence factor